MRSNWYEPVLALRAEMKPIETGVRPLLKPLDGVRAVVFDVYGTLLVSGTGDVGSAPEETGPAVDQVAASIAAAGIDPGGRRIPTVDDLHRRIRQSNRQRQSPACVKPEVDIVDLWRRVLVDAGIRSVSTMQCHRLAAEYEARTNPTWPMPDAAQVLREIAGRGLRLGIVSNAQVFTVPLVEELGGSLGGDSVFDSNLCVFSNRYRQAKPGPRLFDVLCFGLHAAGIQPAEAIYVGNDRLNDVWAASQAGLRTAWFAGDRRSLRDRADDHRVAALPHDLVLTELKQLLDCLPPAGSEHGSQATTDDTPAADAEN